MMKKLRLILIGGFSGMLTLWYFFMASWSDREKLI